MAALLAVVGPAGSQVSKWLGAAVRTTADTPETLEAAAGRPKPAR
jgi:hypothetical protein